MMRLAELSVALALAGQAALGADYHVDQGHPSASDANAGTADAPWLTIGKATAAAEPGDVILIGAGIYREHVRPGADGTPDRPIVYRAAPGAEAVVSGADRITGWQAGPDGVWHADVDWAPPALYLDGRLLPMARTPNEGWWVADGGGEDTLADAANLPAVGADAVGAEVFWWDVDTTSQMARRVTAAADGTLTVDKPWGYGRAVQAGADRYYLRGRLAFLDRPGEWAVEPAGDGFRVHLRPPAPGDPGERLVEAARRDRFVVEYGKHRHLVFDGLEIRHGAAHGIGSWTPGSAGIRIVNCHVHDNLGNGVYLRGVEDALVSGCRIVRNGNGVAGHSCKGAVLAGCEVADNDYDGVVFSHDSADVEVRGNFIHGHNRWGHPDNMQLHNSVTRVRIEGNVLLDGGQALMMQQVTDGVLRGNLIVGAEAYAVILGHNSVDGFVVDGNTIALCGWGAVNSSAGAHTVTNNLLCPGIGSAISSRDAEGLTSDHNLSLPAAPGDMLLSVGGIWTGSLEEHQAHTALDGASVAADPLFMNAPAVHGVVDPARLMDCTRTRLYLRTPAAAFAAGDGAELAFDGVRRTVTEVGADFIEFEPQLDAVPEKGAIVLNWRDNEDMRLDFRPSPESPALGGGAEGADLGTPLRLPDLRDSEAVLQALRAAGS